MSEKPYTVLSGEARNVIFESPHQGCALPDEFHRYPRLVEAADNRWDHFIDEAGQTLLDAVGGQSIHSHVSRLLVDLNRGADRIDSRVCPRWPGAREYEDGGAIVPNTLLQGKRIPLYDFPLDDGEVEDRLRRFWYPYHDRLRQLVDTAVSAFGTVLLISLHSVNPSEQHISGRKPVVYLGTQNGRTCDPTFLERLEGALENHGITAVSRDHYQGAFTTQAYGVEQAVNTIQIELDRRALKDRTCDRVKRMLDGLADGIRAISRSSVFSSSLPARVRRMGRSKSYFDPLTGETFPDS